jgi:hypothetical protein
MTKQAARTYQAARAAMRLGVRVHVQSDLRVCIADGVVGKIKHGHLEKLRRFVAALDAAHPETAGRAVARREALRKYQRDTGAFSPLPRTMLGADYCTDLVGGMPMLVIATSLMQLRPDQRHCFCDHCGVHTTDLSHPRIPGCKIGRIALYA